MANTHIRVNSNYYEKVKTFQYLGSLLATQNSIHEEIEYRLKQKLIIYSVQTLRTSRLLSTNLEIKLKLTQNKINK